ncbi:hypothetical protein CsatB_012061 [Cannabis sativa]
MMSCSSRGSLRTSVATMEAGHTTTDTNYYDSKSKWLSGNIINPSIHKIRLIQCLSGINGYQSNDVLNAGAVTAATNKSTRKAEESLQTVMYLNCWALS